MTLVDALDAPPTCQCCGNHPAAQSLTAHHPHNGLQTSLVCERCGDEQEPQCRAIFGRVWRYQLTPLAVEVPTCST